MLAPNNPKIGARRIGFFLEIWTMLASNRMHRRILRTSGVGATIAMTDGGAADVGGVLRRGGVR